MSTMKLPACRDKHGHLVHYPGRIVYVHDNFRLIYIGTLDGRHEFMVEHSFRENLGSISFAEAVTAVQHRAKASHDR